MFDNVRKHRTSITGGNIVSKTPWLRILDEITNNFDLEKKEHVTQVFKEYPGATIIACVEEDFLKAINVDHT